MKTSPAPLKVKSAKGVCLELDNGQTILDCISSWWVNIHGHCEPTIAAAIAEQANKLEQVIFAGFTHEPALELADRLLPELPPGLSHMFFSDDGSTAVEVALKMACQYWSNLGSPERCSFIGLEGGYHGDTVGAMSAGSSSGFWSAFKKLLFPIDVIPFPDTFDNDAMVEQKEQQALHALQSFLSSNPEKYAAIIMEPLIQGAAGMRMCRPSFLESVRALASEFNTLLIFDEVMTGFGRTGEWFASRKAHVSPDIITLSKGLTGGFLPLALTVCSENVYSAFYKDDLHSAFLHSHSYTANPIACAASIASLKLLKQNAASFRGFEKRHRAAAKTWLSKHPLVHKLRFCGTIAAFDLNIECKEGYFGDLGPKLRATFLREGLLLRPLGTTIYLMPPYCTDNETLERMYGTIRLVIDRL